MCYGPPSITYRFTLVDGVMPGAPTTLPFSYKKQMDRSLTLGLYPGTYIHPSVISPLLLLGHFTYLFITAL